MIPAFDGIDGCRLVGVEGNPPLVEITGNPLGERRRRGDAVRRGCRDRLPVDNSFAVIPVPEEGGTGGLYPSDGYSSRKPSRSRSWRRARLTTS